MTRSDLVGYEGGRGEPVALIPGLGCGWRVWKPILPALCTERHVVALDLPGFAGSARLPVHVRPTVAALADAVERELEGCGLRTAHLVGNSLGGWIALELARRGRASSVVAISPAGLGSTSERARAVQGAQRAYMAAKLLAPWAVALTSLAAMSAFLFAEVHSRPWRLSPEEASQSIVSLARSVSFLETLEWTVARERAEQLEDIRCPVLIAWGTEDRVLPPGQAAQFMAAIPRAELRLLFELGHIPMPDDPELVSRTILDFTGSPRANAGSAPRARREEG